MEAVTFMTKVVVSAKQRKRVSWCLFSTPADPGGGALLADSLGVGGGRGRGNGCRLLKSALVG